MIVYDGYPQKQDDISVRVCSDKYGLNNLQLMHLVQFVDKSVSTIAAIAECVSCARSIKELF